MNMRKTKGDSHKCIIKNIPLLAAAALTVVYVLDIIPKAHRVALDAAATALS